MSNPTISIGDRVTARSGAVGVVREVCGLGVWIDCPDPSPFSEHGNPVGVDRVDVVDVKKNPLDVLVECPVCNGSKKSKYTGMDCGCCNATGTITERSRLTKAMIAKDISERPHT